MAKTLASVFAVETLPARSTAPVFSEVEVDPGEGPLVVSTSRGTFLPTRPTAEGFARYAFFPCQEEVESRIFVDLYRVLCEGLARRAPTVSELVAKPPPVPAVLVVSPSTLAGQVEGEISEAEIVSRMNARGYVLDRWGFRVLAAPLPPGGALALLPPAVLCVRASGWLGVLLRAVDRASAIVDVLA